jgi:transcriptional regulator with XRE-family HTH domain
MAIDRELLATYIRNKMVESKLSLRGAAEASGVSPATLSRLLGGAEGSYEPDTAVLTRIANWLGKKLGELESDMRPTKSSLAEVELHLHALPDLTPEDARSIMNVIKLMYDEKRTSSDPE